MLTIDGLQKTYAARGGGQPVHALRGVSCHVEQGEFFALLGPSGCGKTTMLQSIAGLETPDRGEIRIGDRTVFNPDKSVFVPASQRKLGMVFQSYAIWPHMTVFDNVAFPLVHGAGKVAGSDIRARVMTALERVKLTEYADRLAPHLSGGQQQRVALARAIVHEPRLLLLDEPLSNLDARLRDTMREELRRLVKSLGITTIFVTHDQVEAMGMADRVAVLQGGSVVQIGPPEEIYYRPKTAFAANFVGRSNTLPGKLTAVERIGENHIRRFQTPIGEILSTAQSELAAGEEGLCIIRPQAFRLAAAGHTPNNADNRIEGTLISRSFLGDTIEAQVRVRDTDLRIVVNSYDPIPDGTEVALSVATDHCMIVPAER